MASRKKVLKYLGENRHEGSVEAFRNLVATHMMNGFATIADQAFYQGLENSFVTTLGKYEVEFYMRHYTDAEIDQLIKIRELPIKKKQEQLDTRLSIALSDLMSDIIAQALR